MTTINNLYVSNIVADIITEDGDNRWLVAELHATSDSIVIEYGVRTHKYESVPCYYTELYHRISHNTTWADITAHVYDSMTQAVMTGAARYAVDDRNAYLTDLQGDKLLKRAFIAWRDALRDGNSFSTTIKGSR